MHQAASESGATHQRGDAPPGFTAQELAQINLLKDTHLDAVEPLLLGCPVRLLESGEVLVRAGDSCPALYLVVSGRLLAQDPAAVVPDSLIKAGDSLGELFLLQDAVAAWTISAVESTRLLMIDTDMAWTLVAASHAFARNLLTLIAKRARVTVAAGGGRRTSSKRHATLDEGTGLHKRTWLESILPRQMMRSAMSTAPLGLLLLEIDGFAAYNEQFGAVAGDHARYAVAQTLVNNVRPTDLLACYGPAQFAVVLPEANLNGARLVGERVRNAVSEAVILMSDESILPSITVSIGAAQFRTSTEAPAFLQAAEAALQTAQGTGGNRLCG